MFLVHGMLFGVWATQIPLIKERLQLDTAILGSALICAAIGGAAAMQFAGWLMRRLGAVTLLRITTLLGCGLLPVAVISENVWMLGGVLVLFGAGSGLIDLVMNAQAVEVEVRAGRPIMSGLHGMWSLGGLCGAALGSLLLALLTPVWQAAIMAGAGAALILWVSASMLPMGGGPRHARAPRIRGLMWRGPLVMTGMLMALAFSIEGVLLDWSAIFLREIHHLPASEAGLGYAAFAAAMLVGRLTGDRMRARWSDRRMLQGPFLAALFLAFAALVPSSSAAIAGFALTGIMLCNVAPILFNVAGRLGEAAGPGGATQSVAAVVSFGYAGVMGGPPLMGFVARQTSLPVALCVAAGFCLLLALGARAIPAARI